MEAGGNLGSTNDFLLPSLGTEGPPFAFCGNRTLKAVESRLFIQGLLWESAPID